MTIQITPQSAQIKAVAFDLDGTLVNSLGLTFKAFSAGFESAGRDPMQPAEIMKYFGPDERTIFSQTLGEASAETAYQAYCKVFSACLEEASLHHGVADLLSELARRKIPLAIFTGRGIVTTQMLLKHHAINHHFVAVVANEHVANPKPAPDGVTLAVKYLGFKPQEVLYVGDSPLDILSGNQAGCVTVAATWDTHSTREKLAAAGPMHWISHPIELLKILS